MYLKRKIDAYLTYWKTAKNVNKIYKKGLAKFIALQVLLDFYSAWSESAFVLWTVTKGCCGGA